ncbi:transcriptional regulator [Clostridium acetobutylicum EA 2018]|nr:transcriptional regulator [Clostridium acetobutylicum EA 2018]
MRYNEIKRSLPKITNIMLTRSLQSLEQYGLVKRVEYNKIPPHVEYSLTDRCNDLLPALVIMNEWSKKLLKLQK